MLLNPIQDFTLQNIVFLNIKTYMERNKVSQYLSELIKKNPLLTSGRHNYKHNQNRIFKILKLIKKFKKNQIILK